MVNYIINNESYCNYYLYVNKFYELFCELCDDEGLMVNGNFRKYGIDTLKVKAVIPTELPVLEVSEEAMDFVFLLKDDTNNA